MRTISSFKYARSDSNHSIPLLYDYFAHDILLPPRQRRSSSDIVGGKFNTNEIIAEVENITEKVGTDGLTTGTSRLIVNSNKRIIRLPAEHLSLDL